MKIMLPQPGQDTTVWAEQLVRELTLAFAAIPEAKTGEIVLLSSTGLFLEGFLLCNGATFARVSFPSLAKVLPETTPGNFAVPTLTGPAGTLYAIRV